MSQGILNAGLVAEAFNMVHPPIQFLLNSGKTRGKNLVIVATALEEINPSRGKTFAENCFLVKTFGDPAEFPANYRGIALSKAELSVRTGLPNSKMMPQYLLDRDTVNSGSVVLDGIVVAASGDHGYFDEMFSFWLASTIQALCKKRFAALKANDEINFVP